MARDAIQSLEERLKRYKNIEQEWLRSTRPKRFMEDIAEQIRKRTRLGKGVKENGDLEKLGGTGRIEESTIAYRKRYRKNLSDLTTYKRSNLTATGQLLDNIKHEFKNGIMTFFFSGTRRKELSGKGRGVKNSEVARHVSKERPFFRLSNTEQRQFARRLRNEFLEIIRGR